MRTTLDLTPEAYHLAKAVARERKQSMGAVVSEFIVKPAEEREKPGTLIRGISKAGFPTFHVVGAKPVSTEDVKRMMEEMQDEEDARNAQWPR